MRNYLAKVLEYHNSARTVVDYIHNVNPNHRDAIFYETLIKKAHNDDELALLIETTRRDLNTTTAGRQRQGINQQIHFAEQEFTAMDWECSRVDPRWNNTLSIIMLRHPIERHLSEFFYSGPGSVLALDAKKLFDSNINYPYRKKVQKILRDELPLWLNATGGDRRSLSWFFGGYYTDNFQVRALAGCARGSCLNSKNLTSKENATLSKGIQFALNTPFTNPNGACTMYLDTKGKIMKTCSFAPTQTCPYGCDTPCFYPVPAWGPIEHLDLSRAISALNSYDAVFLTESLDNYDQYAFLADVVGVPHNATFSLQKKNTNTKKINNREKTHFYRDLLMNLTLDELYERLHKENDLEIQLFEYAVKLNQEMIKYWKTESGWID